MYFRRFVFPVQSHPMVEGLIGAVGNYPTHLMLFQHDGSRWDTRSFPDLPSEPDFIASLDANRTVVGVQTAGTSIYLIENSQARKLNIGGRLDCIAAHSAPSGLIFLHCFDGSVLEVNGSTVTRLGASDASNYVHNDGNPTGMRRAFIRDICKADTGETMGIYYQQPTALGPAALVRFNGKLLRSGSA